MMPNLILVRHSLPEIIPSLPAHQWRLSEAGRARCNQLAGKIRAYSPQVVVSSLEPKAQETAQLVADRLGLVSYTAEGLHEHERTKAQWTGQAEFERKVAEFFEYPQQLVMGEETASQASDRFAGAVMAQIEKHPGSNLAIVAHGTVMALFVARTINVEPFLFWKRLGLPAFVVFALPEMALVTVVEEI
jgi:broad specificity phosphatase PhoE